MSVPQLPADTIPGYQLLDTLSEGVRSSVHLARSLATQDQVVVKIAQPGASLTEEAAKLAELRGAAVAEPLAIGFGAAGEEFIVFQGHGPTLALILAASPVQKLDPQTAVVAVQAVARAVETLHRREWIHGDLKPSNVLFPEPGTALLIDLELAQKLP